MKTRSLLALLLALAVLLPLLAACNPGGSSTTEPPTTTVGPTTTLPTTTAPEPPTTQPSVPGPEDPVIPSLTYLPLEDLADYTIVYPEIAGDAALAAIEAFRDAIATETGVTLPVVSDAVAIGETVPTGTKEILLGATNRYESSAAPTLRYYDFYVTVENGRLVLLAPSDAALISALGYATENMLAEGKLSYPEGGYFHEMIYPLDTITLAGRPITDFVIVRDMENGEVAQYLAKCITDLTGYLLPIHAANDPEVPYEILIGNTGRVATNAPPAGKYVVDLVGTKLALYGSGTHAAYRATLSFAETYLDGKQATLEVVRLEDENRPLSLYSLNLPDELEPITLEHTENTGGVLERFLKTKDALPTEVTVVAPVKLTDYPFSAKRQEIFVAPDGDDDNPGTIDAPLATLAEAVLRTRHGGGVIWMRGGSYEVNEAVKLTDFHSGTAASPLFIKAYGNEKPVLSTYKRIETSWFGSVESGDPLAERFDPDINPQDILVANLADHGFTPDDITELVSSSDAYGDTLRQTRYGVTPVMLIGNTEYGIARYPNPDEELLSYAYAYESGRVTSATGSEIYYNWVDRVTKYAGTWQGEPITLDTPIPWEISLGTRNLSQQKDPYDQSEDWERYAPILDWVDTGNIWFYGRVYSDWNVGAYNVHVGRKANGDYVCFENDPNKPSIQSTMPASLGARSTSRADHAHHFYLFNAIEALDAPGEWFIDVENEKLPLYFYPTEEFYSVSDIGYTAGYAGNILELDGVSNLVIDGLSFIGVADTAIYSPGSKAIGQISIQNCEFSNLGNHGINIIQRVQGDGVAVLFNTFSKSNGGAMVSLMNNTAPSMIPDHNVIQNNIFYDPAPNHQVGIQFAGCVTVVSHNYLVNTNISVNNPTFECIVEYNRLDGGSEDVGDGGQIYMYGLYTRGNHIRYNVCHALNYSGNSIYNDGMCSGNYSYYNICSTLTGYRESVQKCFYVSTGHNNVAFNNIFIVRDEVRFLENLELHGREPMNAKVSVQGGEKRHTGDCGIYESTLFYADKTDAGYTTPSGGEDAASYSWDALYKSAAGRYTGNIAYTHYNYERFSARFPNFIKSMEGAWQVFVTINEQAHEYDRRTAVLALEAGFDAAVKLFTGEVPYDITELQQPTHPLWSKYDVIEDLVAEHGTSLTETEAEALAFELGYGYTEDFFRQPAYNIYDNNVILGGDSKFYFDTNNDGICGNSRTDFVTSDYLSNNAGFDDFGNAVGSGNTSNPFSKDLRLIGENYYNHDFDEVLANADIDMWSADYADYSFLPGVLESIQNDIPDFYEFQYIASGRAGIRMPE